MAERVRCEICDRTFKDADGLAQHNAAKHSELVEKPKKPLPVKKIRNWAIFFIFIGLLTFGAYSLISKDKSSGNVDISEKSVDIPREAIHWHPKLRIVINGEEQIIPSNLGISANFHHPIHTHDISGTLHYENSNPSAKTMRLGYFFNTVWRKTFDNSCIFEFCNGDSGTVKMFVNGKENFEFNNYIPKDGDDILIEYTKV